MRFGWVWFFGFLLLPPVALAKDAVAAARITPEIRAFLTRDYELEVVVQPHAGDAWTRLAKRVTGNAARWEEIAQFNQSDDNLKAGQAVRVPFVLLRPNLQKDIIQTLFSRDQASPDGWTHVVVGRGIEGESLWKIAEWFTGDGANYAAIRKANLNQGLSTRNGDVILVPKRLLTAAFGGGTEGENASSTAAEVRAQDNDPAQRPSADEELPEVAATAVAMGVSLSYERDATEPYAVYRLQKGEALYSSVAIRFTGRVYSQDVGEVLEQIVKFNGIEDVARMPIGYPVQIPMDLLLPEYLPPDDPARLAAEAAKRESAKYARRTRAKNLTGVHVIVDAGHGGRDSGTAHDDVWESIYVYDVACRLKRILEKTTAAKVSMTTRSTANGYSTAKSDVIEPESDHYLQTTPPYDLEDAIVGVNLRWYLANSIFRHAMKSGTTKEKVVFISIHADSLHPALRGGMAYIPGGRFVTGSYQKREPIYFTRAEVREKPKVRHSENDALEAEGLSRDLAESVIASFLKSGLKVHPFNPIRDNVVRENREWVPAVIRYNVVPTRMLLEVCNLGNRRDRALIQTRTYRQKLAEAIGRGLSEYYKESRDESLVVSR